jgi:hypothetical protein
MSNQLRSLDRITIPTPCDADWDSMAGNDQIAQTAGPEDSGPGPQPSGQESAWIISAEMLIRDRVC